MLEDLANPLPYLSELDRLREKYERMHRLDALEYRGLTLGDVGTNAEELARRLAATVSGGDYRLSPVDVRPALIAGKVRLLCRSHLLDTIVLGVLSRVLVELAEPVLSPRVYSYRAGRSSWETLGDLRRFFTDHRSSRQKRERGLFVLHRDIKSYGEAIPTDDGSVLWQELELVFTRARVPEEHPIRRLARGALRPEVHTRPGDVAPRIGVPTGSPVQPLACNLYLSTVDRLLENIDGGFYARFGDDMLFVHPDASVARRAAFDVDRIVRGLGLEVKAEKRRDYYLTDPGRPSHDWPESKPTSHFDYLGFRLTLEGRVGLKAEKSRRLLRALRARIRAAARTLGTADSAEARAATLCAVVHRALDPSSPLADPAAGVLRYVVTDRGQLKYLDHALALAIAEAVAGRRGPRAFRDVPHRSLRTESGLPSLVVNRNRESRRGRGNATGRAP
jgi:hypothetical protein